MSGIAGGRMISVLLALFLLAYALAPAADASTQGEVQVYYLYSPECISCQQSWPLIKADLDEAQAQAQAQISLNMFDIHTREGAGFAREHGISSVPAIVFDDGSMVLFEQYGDPQSFEAAFQDMLRDRIGHRPPVTIKRNVTRSDSSPGVVTVKTCVECCGDRPTRVDVKGAMPEGSATISGSESWSGVLQPGESQCITCTCQIPRGTRLIPPVTISYDDGGGLRSTIGPGTPIIGLQELSGLAVYLAGLIAGINPCLLAIMAFIGTTAIADTGHRRAVILRIIAFSGGMLAVYLLVGVGLMGLIGKLPIMAVALRASIILLLTGLSAWSFYDAWQTKKGEEGRRNTFKSILRRLRPLYIKFGLAASFAIGGVFGLVKMPCVGGIYIAILGAILESGVSATGITLLLIYNLGVITPVLLLGTLITVGLSPAAVNQFRLRHRVALKVFTGVLLVIMTAAFLAGVM